MVAYQDFFRLSQSDNSEERGQAAHLAALAFLRHDGPAEEHAALYAALIGFLDDPSVKVRASLAYGLLHAREAPRPILLALLQDSMVIARAVAQYSPALLDADLISLARTADLTMLSAVALRDHLGERVVEALAQRHETSVTVGLLTRPDVVFSAETLTSLTARHGNHPAMRGALLGRADLPPAARLELVNKAAEAIGRLRIVWGAVAPNRLERLVQDCTDTALTSIGERSAATDDGAFAALLTQCERVSIRVMLHAVVNGHVVFFADCLSALSEAPREKVFTILETGSRSALNALLARCGLEEAVRNLMARLIFHARSADLADDVTARHYVVTALTEELIVDHDGNIPPELEDAFSYLSDQNVVLARRAARGVMSAFVEDDRGLAAMPLPELEDTEQAVLEAPEPTLSEEIGEGAPVVVAVLDDAGLETADAPSPADWPETLAVSGDAPSNTAEQIDETYEGEASEVDAFEDRDYDAAEDEDDEYEEDKQPAQPITLPAA